jgi:hypothetical protein
MVRYQLREVDAAVLDTVWRGCRADPFTDALLERILIYPGLPDDWRALKLEPLPRLLTPLRVAKDGFRLSLFTTLTVLGAPEEVTIPDLAIEYYFPANEATDRLFRIVMA